MTDVDNRDNRTKIEAMRRFIRREAARFLDDPNITSLGTGHKIKNHRSTDELCVQFTVRTKLGDDGVMPEGLITELIPTTLEIDGDTVPTDVIERDYEPAFMKVVAEQADQRKERQDPIVPGISIANVSSTAGTLGLVVFDRRTGAPCVLSNWHVLHGGDGNIGDDIVQPGPFDDNSIAGNVCGQLLRSHLGEAGDCAISSITSRHFERDIFDLKVAPSEIVRVDLGDRVVKSGRTTGVTSGIVRRVDVVVEMTYPGEGTKRIGGFEIGPVGRVPADVEISKGGDSGSVWLITDAKGAATKLLAGLHFAGETASSDDEHALACYAHSVFKKLDISLTTPAAEQVVGGYDEGFVGEAIPLPTLSQAIIDDAVELDGEIAIPYTHFSVCMSESRGFARYVAWNINGSSIRRITRSGIAFKLDERISEDFQHGDELYDDNKLDRGHIARRADLCWGAEAEAERANLDSFFFTNITPQHKAFNQSSLQGLWGLLENEIFEGVDVADLHVSVMGGPVFHDDDPTYRDVQLPREFWKLIAYRDAADGATKVRAYVLTQQDLLNDIEALDLDPFALFQVSLDRLSDFTALGFGALTRFDTFVAPEGPEALSGGSMARRVTAREEILA